MLAGSAWAKPSITIVPDRAYPGDEITIKGTGFRPGKRVTCESLSSFIPEGLGVVDVIGDALSDGTGSFQATVKLPNHITGGTDRIQCDQASTPITITPRLAKPVEVPPLPGDSESEGVGLNDIGQAVAGSFVSTLRHGLMNSGLGEESVTLPGVPSGLNNAGLVIGSAISGGILRPFTCDFDGSGCAGGANFFQPLGPGVGFGSGVNNSNLVVGTAQVGGCYHGYVCRSACIQADDVGTLGGSESSANGIGDDGTVAGSSQTTGNAAYHAFFCRTAGGSCGPLQDLGTLGGVNSFARVAFPGYIGGDAQTLSGIYDPVLWQLNGKPPLDLGALPGQTDGATTGIALDGGLSAVGFSGPRGFIWSGGQMFQLDLFLPPSSGWTVIRGDGINRFGEIIGTGQRSDGLHRALILVPAAGPSREPMVEQVSFENVMAETPARALRPIRIPQGGTVQWVNNGPQTHSVADSTGMNPFRSPQLGPGRGYAFTFVAAGTYPYKDGANKGTVSVKAEVAPARGRLKTVFHIYWCRCRAPRGYLFDVQIQPPGSRRFALWIKGSRKGLASASPGHGAGTYRFRARLRKKAGGKHSGWSPVVTVRVRR